MWRWVPDSVLTRKHPPRRCNHSSERFSAATTTVTHSDADLAQLLERHAWLDALAAGLVRDEASAADLVQATALAALQHRSRGGRIGRSWLEAVLRRLAAFQYRSDANRRAREEEAAKRDGLPSTLELNQRIELHRRLAQLVDELEEPYRSTVLLYYFEGLSVKRIAQGQGVPQATVRTHLFRARKRLKSTLEREFGRDEWFPLLLLFLTRRPPGSGVSPQPALSRTLLTGGLAAASLLTVGLFVNGLSGRGGRSRIPVSRTGAPAESPAGAFPILRAPDRVGAALRSQPEGTQGHAARDTDGVSATFLVVDASSGEPLPRYDLGPAGSSDEAGRIMLHAGEAGIDLRLLDDAQWWERQGRGHWLESPPTMHLNRPLFDAPPEERRIAVVTGPSFRLRFDPVPLAGATPMRVRLTSPKVPLQNQEWWVTATTRTRWAGGGTAWLRFLPLPSELLAAGPPWRMEITSADGLQGASVELDRIEGQENDVAVRLEPRGRLEVQVQGSLEDDGLLRLYRGEELLQVTSLRTPAQDLPIRFDGLMPGEYRLRTSLSRYRDSHEEVTLVGGEVRPVSLALEALTGLSTLSGTLHRTGGKPKSPTALVMLEDPRRVDGVRWAYPNWEEDGEGGYSALFRFENVPPGEYRVEPVSPREHVTCEPPRMEVHLPGQPPLEFVQPREVERADLRFRFRNLDLARGELAVVYRIDGGPWRRLYRERAPAKDSSAVSWNLSIGGSLWARLREPILLDLAADAELEWYVLGDGVALAEGSRREIVHGPDGEAIEVELERGWSLRVRCATRADRQRRPLEGVRFLSATRELGRSDERGFALIGGPGAPPSLRVEYPGLHPSGGDLDPEEGSWRGSCLLVWVILEP